jgi:hypothetical protein
VCMIAIDALSLTKWPEITCKLQPTFFVMNSCT